LHFAVDSRQPEACPGTDPAWRAHLELFAGIQVRTTDKIRSRPGIEIGLSSQFASKMLPIEPAVLRVNVTIATAFVELACVFDRHHHASSLVADADDFVVRKRFSLQVFSANQQRTEGGDEDQNQLFVVGCHGPTPHA